MDADAGTFYPTSPERKAQAVLVDAAAASSAAIADQGTHVTPYGPIPRGTLGRPGPATKGEGQPSATFGVQQRLFESEVEKDNLRIQLGSVVAQFRARESWWRLNVTESKDQVVAGIFQNHQFELEARQQWEHRLRSVESLVDEAVSYTSDQASILHARSEQIIVLEQQMSALHVNATSEVARLSQRVLEEGQAISQYRGEVYALHTAAIDAEAKVASLQSTSNS